jgi:hypothetical protein
MQTKHIDELLENAPVDTEGSSAFRANAAHMTTLKVCFVASLAAAVLMAGAALFALSRPPQVAVIRVDDVRGAELVKVGATLELRPAEIRTALWHWCIWRYRLLKSSAKADFGQSYYFLSGDITAKYRDADAQRVAMILAGSQPEQTVDVRTIAIPPLRKITVGSKELWSGQAQAELVTSENLNTPAGQPDPTRKKWRVNLEFVVDPVGAAKRGLDDPQYEILNPLGITITSYYETQEPGDGR